jgi:hypothetical protein
MPQLGPQLGVTSVRGNLYKRKSLPNLGAIFVGSDRLEFIARLRGFAIP